MKSILLNYAQPMKSMGNAPYYYDYGESLNVYSDKDNVIHPFVESPDNILCVSTKTETINESDDTVHWGVALATKTFTVSEADD